MSHKLYKKQIRPMISPPALHGQVWHLEPFPNLEDCWYDEETRDIVKEFYSELITDPMSSLGFDERYVEVEMPKPKVVNYRPGDMLLLRFDMDKIDVATAVEIMHKYEEMVPDTVTIVLLPNMNCDSLDKEEAQLWLDEFRKKVESMK